MSSKRSNHRRRAVMKAWAQRVGMGVTPSRVLQELARRFPGWSLPSLATVTGWVAVPTALRVPCPRCGARALTPCQYPGGRVREAHRVRREAALHASICRTMENSDD